METRIGVADGLDLLMNVMPTRIRVALEGHPQREELLEVVLDLGRLPEARFTDSKEALSQTQVIADTGDTRGPGPRDGACRGVRPG